MTAEVDRQNFKIHFFFLLKYIFIIQFIIYEYLKRKFKSTKHQAALYFIAGAISKAISTCVTYPYQTVKTNLQAASKEDKLTQINLIQKIFFENGIKGFYHGLSPKLFQTVLNNALLLMIYEKFHILISLVVGYILKKRP